MTLKSAFWLVVLFILAVCLATFGNFRAGAVMFYYPPYSIRVSFVIFILGFLIVFFILYWLMRLLHAVVRMPRRVQTMRQHARQHKSHRALLSALNYLHAGHFAKAEKAAKVAMKEPQNFSAACLLAARVAHETKAFDQRDHWLSLIEDEKWHDARYMTEASMHVNVHDSERALVALDVVQDGAKQQRVFAQKIALQAQQQLNHWPEVAKILKELEKHDALSPVMQTKLRHQAEKEMLKEQGLHPLALKEVWAQFPQEDQHEAELIKLMVQLLMNAGHYEEARKILVKTLKHQWNPALLDLYPDAADDDVLVAIQQVEKWRLEHGSDPHLLLALARLCFKQGLWGKSESFCHDALKLVRDDYPMQEKIYYLLAKLKEQLGDEEKANQYYRESALLKAK